MNDFFIISINGYGEGFGHGFPDVLFKFQGAVEVQDHEILTECFLHNVKHFLGYLCFKLFLINLYHCEEYVLIVLVFILFYQGFKRTIGLFWEPVEGVVVVLFAMAWCVCNKVDHLSPGSVIERKSFLKSSMNILTLVTTTFSF
jgi:hypothetical protein